MSEERLMVSQGHLHPLLDAFHERVRKYSAAQPFNACQVYGVPRGGIPVAMYLAGKSGFTMVDDASRADLIVDDIFDSGKTAARFREAYPNTPFEVLIDKREDPWTGQWVTLPWEVSDRDSSADDIVTRLLEYIGEDPTREGLVETPARVLKAWREWAEGYHQDPKDILKMFEDGAEGVNEMVLVTDIPVISKCEHHLADITGVAHVGYIPNGKIVGLSKLARLTDLYARRLQVQERLTNQIANALEECLDAKGVGVIIRATHACMSSRGVKIKDSLTTTSAMRGVLLTNTAARLEFLNLCTAAERNAR